MDVTLEERRFEFVITYYYRHVEFLILDSMLPAKKKLRLTKHDYINALTPKSKLLFSPPSHPRKFMLVKYG
jgi:hypothetical protein